MELTDFIKIRRISQVRAVYDDLSPEVEGVVIVTPHVLCFDSELLQVQVLHKMVLSVKSAEKDGKCLITCKDFHRLTLTIPRIDDCLLLVETLSLLSSISNVNLMFPFYCYSKSQDKINVSFDERLEFQWLNCPPDNWEISPANKDYQITDSYGTTLVIPRGWDDVLKRLASSRVKGMVPRPTFLHKHSPKRDCMLVTAGDLRESTGTLQYKIQDKEYREWDEQYMGHLAKCSGSGVLVTSLNFIDKVINKRSYPGWRQVRVPIDLEDLTSSIGEIRKGNWTSGHRKWLDLVWKVLSFTNDIIKYLTEEGSSVLLETLPQLFSSLVQICVESRYRTCYGLLTVILHKEWVNGGYSFRSESDSNSCALFLLFLHSLRQLQRWYPRAFQYSPRLLARLYGAACAGRFGDFLGDSPAERDRLGVAARTQAICSGLGVEGQLAEAYLNPSYRPFSSVLVSRHDHIRASRGGHDHIRASRVWAPGEVVPWTGLMAPSRDTSRLVQEARARLYKRWNRLRDLTDVACPSQAKRANINNWVR